MNERFATKNRSFVLNDRKKYLIRKRFFRNYMNIIELSNTLSTYFVNYEKIFCYYLKQLKTVQVQYRSSVSCAK